MGVLLEEVVAEAGLWVWPLLDSHHFPPEGVDYAGGGGSVSGNMDGTASLCSDSTL